MTRTNIKVKIWKVKVWNNIWFFNNKEDAWYFAENCSEALDYPIYAGKYNLTDDLEWALGYDAYAFNNWKKQFEGKGE